MTYIIYSKQGCENCEKAKRLLTNEKKIIIECDQMLKNNRGELIKSLELKTHRPFKTFPLIFVDDMYVGDYEDLVEYLAFEMNEEF